jgi:hypothetical protein
METPNSSLATTRMRPGLPCTSWPRSPSMSAKRSRSGPRRRYRLRRLAVSALAATEPSVWRRPTSAAADRARQLADILAKLTGRWHVGAADRGRTHGAHFSECVLISKAKQSDFDSAMRRFESSRPSQPQPVRSLLFDFRLCKYCRFCARECGSRMPAGRSFTRGHAGLTSNGPGP